MASNKISDQDELNDSVSKADIDKMIRFLHAHTDYKVVKDPEPRHSTPTEVKFKTEGFTLSSTKLPPSPPVRSSSFLLSNALKGNSLFCDTSSCNAYQKPKLPIFSGEEKSETSFDVWKLEVKCVLREGNCTGSSVLQAIRGSLKGKARSLLLSLSEHATAENIIDKLDGVYGNVYSSEALLEKFFKETQQPNQSVAEYGMKLESIIQSAVEKGDVSIVAKNQMVKSKFWSGLRDPLLKKSSRYKFDTTKDFDQLRKEMQAIELELANSDKGITTVQHQPISSDSRKHFEKNRSHG